MSEPAAQAPGSDAPILTSVEHRRLWIWQLRIFVALWTGYAAYYLCRVNFAVAQPAIERDLGWSSAQIGWIPSIYATFYALGQFVNGQLGERLGARRMMTGALLVALATNLGMSAVSSYSAMLVLWAVNGYAQSAGWSLVIKTISSWTTSRRRGTVIGLISTCYQVGNVVSWLLAGALCDSGWGWRSAFWVPALILLPITLGFLLFVRNDPRDVDLPTVRDDLAPSPGPATDGEEAAATAPAPVLAAPMTAAHMTAAPMTAAPMTAAPMTAAPMMAIEVLRETLSNRLLWILGLGYLCMNSVRYAFLNWAVQYMAEFHGRTIKGSAFTAVALPLIGAVGAVSAGWISDTLFGRRRAPVCALSLFALAALCAAFVHLPAGQWVLATAMLGLAGLLIYGPDMLMSGAATIDVSNPRTAAAATGFTMALGATGAILSGAGVGWLKDRADGRWESIFYVLAGLSAASALLMVSIWNARPRGSR